MSLENITSYVRKAIDTYDMIEKGEKIAIGVSGGKDSLTLLYALAKLSKYHPKKFTVCAISLDMGFSADFSKVSQLCDSLGVEYIVKPTQIKQIIFDIRKENNPCSLCAKMRRGILNDTALENGCKKIALGHHNDDVVETFFLSLLYEGRIHCFAPVTHLDRVGVYQIRPMIYVPEKDIIAQAKLLNLPIVHNPCPANGCTKRQEIKQMIQNMDQETHIGMKKRLFTAIKQSKIDGWKV